MNAACIASSRNTAAGMETNQTRQDAIILNLQRACEAAIDLAMHVVRVRGWAFPRIAVRRSTFSTRLACSTRKPCGGCRRWWVFAISLSASTSRPISR